MTEHKLQIRMLSHRDEPMWAIHLTYDDYEPMVIGPFSDQALAEKIYQDILEMADAAGAELKTRLPSLH